MKKNNFKIKKYFLGLLALLVFLGCASGAEAANSKIYFEVPGTIIPLHSTFTASVFLDTTSPINALDLQVGYSKNALKFISSDNTGSIVNIWQTNPKEVGDGEVHLAGGIFKSFTGEHGLVMQLTFEALTEGPAQISFLKNNVYVADGKGTKLDVDSPSTALSIKENAPPLPASITAINATTPDTTPPVLDVEETTSPVDKSSLIVFQASDTESGIRETDMRIKKWFAYSEWIPVADPVVRPYGAWKVEIKVVNNAGLSTVQSLIWRNELIKKIILLVFLGCLLVFVLIWVYNNRK